MKPDEVKELWAAVSLVTGGEMNRLVNMDNPEAASRFVDAVFDIASHVSEWINLDLYSPDGKPLPVDREWLLQAGGRDQDWCDEGWCVAFGDSVEAIVDNRHVYMSIASCDTEMVIGNIRDFTRPRFLALLIGLGIPHKEHSDAP